jgi:hypothetical protein
VTIGGTFSTPSLHPVHGDEVGGLVAVVVDVVDADMADAVELGANAGPGVHQFIVEGELVGAQRLASLLADLHVVQAEAAVAERGQVLVHRHRQRIGLAGPDQRDRVLDVGGQQVGRADLVVGAVGRGIPSSAVAWKDSGRVASASAARVFIFMAKLR